MQRLWLLSQVVLLLHLLPLPPLLTAPTCIGIEPWKSPGAAELDSRIHSFSTHGQCFAVLPEEVIGAWILLHLACDP